MYDSDKMLASCSNEDNMSNLKFKLTICLAWGHQRYFRSGLPKAEGGHVSQHLHGCELKRLWTNNGVREIGGCSAGKKPVWNEYDVSLTITRLSPTNRLIVTP